MTSTQELQQLYKLQKEKIHSLNGTYSIIINNPLEVTLKQIFDNLNAHHEILLCLEKLMDRVFYNTPIIDQIPNQIKIKKEKNTYLNEKFKTDTNNLESHSLSPIHLGIYQKIYKKPSETTQNMSYRNINRIRNKSANIASRSPSHKSFNINSQDNNNGKNFISNLSEEDTEIILIPKSKKRKFRISPSSLGIQLLQSSYKVLGKYNEQNKELNNK